MTDTELIDNCFNDAARRLPDGWTIEINIESGYAGIVLRDEFGTEVEVDEIHGEPFPARVRRVTTVAVNRYRRGT